jgi:ribosomal protein S18 acetylase RimI-like enzyme
VDEALRGHGIGTQMMEELRVLAKAFGCTDLQLNVYPQNDAAVSFYQKCGFMIQNINMQRKV